ncbi:MAG: hypothetical protein ACRDPD_07030 [Streptosporangiaceae bacterium]
MRYRAAALLVTAGLAALGLAAAAPASAAQAYPWPRSGPVVGHARTYTATWTFKDGSLQRCVTYTVTGGIKYDTQVLEPSGAIVWTDQRLSPQPTFRVSVRAYRGGRCGPTAKLDTMSMGQHWSGYSCGFSPSISAPAPWGTGVSSWPGCGGKSQAVLTSDYGSGSSYTQYTSGAPPVTFGDYGGVPGQDPCYGLYVSSRARVSARARSIYWSSSDGLCLPS